MKGHALTVSRVVLASAGTGKTHALVETYVALLAGLGREPLPPSRILALTFTDRAAAEMRQRILARVRALSAEGPPRDEWLQALGGAIPRADAAALARLEPQLLAAPIGTFHAFCTRVLSEWGPAHGMALALRVLEAAEARTLLHDAALGAVADALGGPARAEVQELVHDLGVGSQAGLVTALAGLLQSLGERGRRAEDLVPADLARDGFDRARQSLPALARSALEAATTPAARTRALEVGRLAAEVAAAAQVEGALDALAALHEAAGGNWGGASFQVLRAQLKEEAARAVSAWAAERGVRVATVFRGLAVATEAAYRARKEHAGACDFLDLLAATRDLLRAHPPVRTRLRERCPAILVDEMQDTSPLQAELLALLVDDGEAPPATPGGARVGAGRLFLVGDRKQGIYGFRGADVALFEEARAAVVASGGEEHRLSESRRSSAPLVALLDGLCRAALGDQWTDGDGMTAVREDGPTPPAHWVRASVPEGTPPEGVRAREARALAAHVASLLRGPGRVEGLGPEGIAVLLRKRTHAELHRAALEAAGVPARVGRGGDLLLRPEVADAAALLALLDDPADVHALAVVLRCPLVLLRDDAITALARAGALAGLLRGAPLPAAVEARLTAEERAAVWRLGRAVAPLAAVAESVDAGDALLAVLDALDGWAVQELFDDGAARCANLRALELVVRGHTVPEAVHRLREAARTGAPLPLGLPEAAGGQVQILTVHEAKGLEWPVVVLADLAGGAGGLPLPAAWHPRAGLAVRIPDHPSDALARTQANTPLRAVAEAARADASAEAGRLLYVALTRARDLLVFCGAPAGRGADADSFHARLAPALERAAGEGRVRMVTDPVAPPLPPPDRERPPPDARQGSLFDAPAGSRPRDQTAGPWLAPWRVPRARWGAPTDEDVLHALGTAVLPDSPAPAALRALHATPLVRALAQVPRDNLRTDVPIAWSQDDAVHTWRAGVVAGPAGGAWTVVDVVPASDAAAARRRAVHLARAVAADRGAPSGNVVLCLVDGAAVTLEALPFG